MAKFYEQIIVRIVATLSKSNILRS